MMEIERNRSPELSHSLELFDRLADRSSHLVGLYPGFQTVQTSHFVSNYYETSKSWIFANEPICAKSRKTETIINLASHANSHHRELILFPCSLDVARELREDYQYSTLMIGVEAVFNLKNYFDDSIIDPLEALPVAKNWKKRGARVEGVDGAELSPGQRSQIDFLTERWKKSRTGPKLSFLNRAEPLLYAEKKRFFFLRAGEEILAFVSLAPVPTQNGYYTADYIRNPSAKAGAIEFLLIETMRALRAERVTEVRMGLCPLARLAENPLESPADHQYGGILTRIFNKSKSPYPFASIYEFKQKLEPTRWEPLYLISPRNIGLSTFWQALTAIFGKSPVSAFVAEKFRGLESMFAQQLNEQSKVVLTENRSFSPWKASLGVSALCAILHYLRLNHEIVGEVFTAYGYRTIDFSWLGWIIGPFFHNTTNHLLGDLASLVFFGYFFEVFFGVKKALPIIALGLWASNPVTLAVLTPILKIWHPIAAQHLLSEVDYGSSNAVYALVGAWAATLRRPSIIIIPFLFNGLVVCYVKESIIALHHWFALFMGFYAFRATMKRAITPKQFQ